MASIARKPLSAVDSESTEKPLSDEALLAAYRQTGDRRLFEELVARYEREIFNYLRRYLGNAQLAEDVFQMAFLMVHLKCDQFEPGRQFRPWLYAIATNAAIDARRRESRHTATSLDRVQRRDLDGEDLRPLNLLTSNDPDPSSEVSRLENGEWIQQALESLSPPMRDVVHLVYYQGLKYREAASVLKVPVGTVKSRLHTAIEKLNEIWKQSHSE